MLRRIIASLILLGLTGIYFAPLTPRAAAAPKQTATPRNSKLAPEFDNAAASPNDFVRVIIQTKGRPSAAHENAINAKGGAKGRTFDSLDAMTAVVPKGALADLAARDDVAYVSPDRPTRGELALTSETTGAALAQAGLSGMPGVTGKGVGIAVVDSGISASHPDFQKNNKSRIVASVNFTGGDGILPGDGQDRFGHGTGVASVAAGNGSASAGYSASYAGIAPEANLIDLKVLGENGTGTTSSTIAAIDWAVTNQKRFNIRVMNLSLGTPVRESFHQDPLCKAVERAVLSGIVVVAAAGNNGHTDTIVGYKDNGDPIYQPVFGAIDSPGNSPYAITVGASDSRGTARRSDDAMAQFSSKGPTMIDRLPKPDLVAPGRAIVAAMSQENPNTAAERPDRVVQPTVVGALQNAYYTYYGTSFSAPVVSGTVALMLEANKSLTPSLVKATLVRTANALPDSLFKNRAENLLTQGAGVVNAAAAVEMARAFVPNADKLRAGQQVFSPNVTLSSLNHTLTIGGERVAAANRVLYSDGVLFRENPVFVNGIVRPDGHAVTRVIKPNGIVTSDAPKLQGDGIIMMDDGIIMMDDGILMMDDGIIMMDDGIIMMDDGIIMMDDGILMMDDGIIMMDDGIIMMDDGAKGNAL
jgi:serine protease AprX